MKKFFLFVITIIICIGVIGCMDNDNGLVTTDNKSKNRVERMLDYINNEYDDTFEFLDEYGGKLFGTTHSIHVSSKNMPNKFVSVFSDISKGEEYFYDNYLDVKYEDQTRELLIKVLEKEFGENIFVAYSSSNAPHKGGELPFEKYVAEDEPIRITFTSIVKYKITDKEEIEKRLEKLFKDNNISCYGKIFFETDYDDLDKLTLDNYVAEYLRFDSYDASIFFSNSVNEGIDDINWEIRHE